MSHTMQHVLDEGPDGPEGTCMLQLWLCILRAKHMLRLPYNQAALPKHAAKLPSGVWFGCQLWSSCHAMVLSDVRLTANNIDELLFLAQSWHFNWGHTKGQCIIFIAVSDTCGDFGMHYRRVWLDM